MPESLSLPTPRFHVSNFGHTLTVQMNEEFACNLVDLIREVKEERGEISSTLYAFTEKIERQFFYMGKLTVRRDEKSPVTKEEEN